MNRVALTLVLIALATGAYLRFNDLGALQMSADEGATWAAADAPSIHEVIEIQQTHNAGKLPLHDLVLHEWIAIFGDGLFAMRSLSALFGLATVLLVVPLTREIFLIEAAGDRPFADSDIGMIAALSALICAVSLVTIKYDRELRMYGLLLALALAHLWVFLRALRLQTIVNHIILAILTSAMLATNFVTTSLLAVEGVWLLVILVSPRIDYSNRIKAIVITGIALLAGVAILSPTFYALVAVGHKVLASGKMNWLEAPPWWEPAAFFNKATGSVAFPILFLLAAFGVWRGWRTARGPVLFALLLMWAPPLLLVIGSFVWRPMFMERYAIYSFPAFFTLIALGIWELDNEFGRITATVIVVILALGHIHSYSLKNHDTQWQQAARVAQASIGPDETIAVAPEYADEVVRYYMYPQLRAHALGYDPQNNRAAVVILAAHFNAAMSAQIHRDFPRVVARARGVVVLAR
ncbi:MAG TPA: hypothetical protein VKV03_11990 [Candidatus Binataceae bacterium]|nr:hypothetical protein [Candidatus Binataceae bacterium]